MFIQLIQELTSHTINDLVTYISTEHVENSCKLAEPETVLDRAKTSCSRYAEYLVTVLRRLSEFATGMHNALSNTAINDVKLRAAMFKLVRNKEPELSLACQQQYGSLLVNVQDSAGQAEYLQVVFSELEKIEWSAEAVWRELYKTAKYPWGLKAVEMWTSPASMGIIAAR